MSPPENSDEALQRVLAGGGLSGAQREAILGKVLRASSPRRPTRWLAWIGLGLLPAAAITAVALTIGFGRDRNPSGEATPKGPAATPILRAQCPGRVMGVCQHGDRLMFEVSPPSEATALAAFAEGPAGRIWYFPAADGHLPLVPSGSAPQILSEGIRLGDEHPRGAYSLHLLLLDAPVDATGLRERILSGQVRARTQVTLPFQIVP